MQSEGLERKLLQKDTEVPVRWTREQSALLRILAEMAAPENREK